MIDFHRSFNYVNSFFCVFPGLLPNLVAFGGIAYCDHEPDSSQPAETHCLVNEFLSERGNHARAKTFFFSGKAQVGGHDAQVDGIDVVVGKKSARLRLHVAEGLLDDDEIADVVQEGIEFDGLAGFAQFVKLRIGRPDDVKFPRLRIARRGRQAGNLANPHQFVEFHLFVGKASRALAVQGQLLECIHSEVIPKKILTDRIN